MDLSVGNRITVGITEEDIRKGVPGRSRECPITLASNRALQPHLLDVARRCGWSGTTSNARYILSTGSHIFGFRLPGNAKRFLWQFDHGLVVMPFTFEMELIYIRDPNEPYSITERCTNE